MDVLNHAYTLRGSFELLTDYALQKPNGVLTRKDLKTIQKDYELAFDDASKRERKGGARPPQFKQLAEKGTFEILSNACPPEIDGTGVKTPGISVQDLMSLTTKPPQDDTSRPDFTSIYQRYDPIGYKASPVAKQEFIAGLQEVKNAIVRYNLPGYSTHGEIASLKSKK